MSRSSHAVRHTYLLGEAKRTWVINAVIRHTPGPQEVGCQYTWGWEGRREGPRKLQGQVLEYREVSWGHGRERHSAGGAFNEMSSERTWSTEGG